MEEYGNNGYGVRSANEFEGGGWLQKRGVVITHRWYGWCMRAFETRFPVRGLYCVFKEDF